MATYFEPGRGTARKKIHGTMVTGGYRFDFVKHGVRYRGAGFNTQQASESAEAKLRERLKLERAGVFVPDAPTTSPRFHNWAGVFMQWTRARAALGEIKAPDAVEDNVSSVLRFFGRRPTDPAKVVPGAPYHDLTLADPIKDASWIRRWDDYLTEQAFAGSTRNHLNGTLSRMYYLAMLAEYRDASGAPPYNPFRDRPRYKWKRRTTTLTVGQVQQWIQCASYHARLAMSIAILNPKFRLNNILQLEWTDIDLAQRLITVWDHKTDRRGEALVSWIPEQLLTILRDARLRHPNATHVILYHGQPVHSIDEAIRNAAIAAKLPWGRHVKNGVTFHSLRHFASTQMARMHIPADQRAPITGHRDLKMEQWYTHTTAHDERDHTEQLSGAIPIAGDVVGGPSRISRPRAVQAATTGQSEDPPSGPQDLRTPGSDAPDHLGGISGLGGTVGGLQRPIRGSIGMNRVVTGLRRGPQSTAAGRRKLLKNQ